MSFGVIGSVGLPDTVIEPATLQGAVVRSNGILLEILSRFAVVRIEVFSRPLDTNPEWPGGSVGPALPFADSLADSRAAYVAVRSRPR